MNRITPGYARPLLLIILAAYLMLTSSTAARGEGIPRMDDLGWRDSGCGGNPCIEAVNHQVLPSTERRIADKLKETCNAHLGSKSNRYRDPPTDLTVELIRNPELVDILDRTPEYGWSLPEESTFQSAYQILVSSSPDKLASNIGDIWNSGRIRSVQ